MTQTELILSTVVEWTKTATKSLNKIKGSLDWINKSTKTATKWMTTFSKDSLSALKILWKWIIWLWTLVGGLAINEFMDFEKQMSKVKWITNATEEQFSDLNKMAKKMWATTQFTATESAKAFEFLWMAWLSVEESMDALQWTLDLASAWTLELWEAADIATNIMAQFWIKAKNIWRVNDVLALSATSANTNILEMSEAMKFLWPVAASMKVSLEESAAAVNVLANNGIKGSMAGQAFSSSLLRLADMSEETKKQADKMGMTFFDVNWKFVWISWTVKILEKNMRGFTDENKAATISQIFWKNAAKQWLTLLKEGSWTIDEYTKKLENSTGAAKKMAETNLDNLAGSFTILKSAVSGALIEIWEAINIELRPKIEELTKIISENWDEIMNFTKVVIKALSLVIKVIWLVIEAWYNLWKVLWFIAAKIQVFATQQIPQYWNIFLNRTKQIWENIQTIIFYVVQWIIENVNNLKVSLVNKITEIKESLINIWENLKQWTLMVFDAIYDYTIWKMQAIIDFAMTAVNIVKNSFKKAGDIASSIWSWISSAASSVGSFVSWARATWWPVSGWSSYLVWEKWPEIFTPNNSWNITPNNQLWGQSININLGWVNINNWMDLNNFIWVIKETVYNETKKANLWLIY